MKCSDFDKWKKARDYVFEKRNTLRNIYGKEYLAVKYTLDGDNEIFKIVSSHKKENNARKIEFTEDSVYVFSIDDVIFQKSLHDKINK